MKLSLDARARRAELTLAPKLYSDEALRIAAAVFDGRAEVYLEDGRAARVVTLEAKRKDLDAAGLEALAGDFLNELLNQEYRFLVSRFNRKIADLISAQTLLSARGGEKAPTAGEETPEFKAKVARLLADTEAEIARTMPRKLPPQGLPLDRPAEAARG